MAGSGTINDLPLAAVETMLARDGMSIDTLNELVAITKDPEKLKLLVAALQRAKAKETVEADRMEEDARELQEAAQAARARVQKADELIRALLDRIGAQEPPKPATP